MPVTFVAGDTNNSGLSAALNSSTADFAVVQAGSYNSTVTGIVEGGGYTNTWTALPDIESALHHGRLFWARLVQKGPGHTFSHTGGSPCIGVALLSGVAASGNPIAAIKQALTEAAGSVTPATNGSLVLAAINMSGGTCDGISSGLTLVDVPISGSSNVGGSLAYLQQATAAPVAPVWSGTGIGTSRVTNTIVVSPVPVVATLTYQDIVLADGAVAYWPLDDAVGSLTARSLAGPPGTLKGGTVLGAPGPTAGRTAARFVGSRGTDYIECGVFTVPRVTTAEAWIRSPNDGWTAQQLFFSNRTNLPGGIPDGLYCGLLEGNLRRAFGAHGANDFGFGSTILTDGLWHHVVVVFDSLAQIASPPSVYVYVDGRLERVLAPLTILADAVGGTATLGGHDDYTGATHQWWNGDLADIAIYPKVLTLADIAKHRSTQLVPSGTGTGDVYMRGSLSMGRRRRRH
jgi:hypothetical protein